MANNIILILTIFVILSGCATPQAKQTKQTQPQPEATFEKYAAKCNSCIGKSIDNVVDSWGYPVQEFKAPNGNTVYAFHKSTKIPLSLFNSGHSYTTRSVYGNARIDNTYASPQLSGDIDIFCTTYFEVDQSKKVIKWQYKGNACRSL